MELHKLSNFLKIDGCSKMNVFGLAQRFVGQDLAGKELERSSWSSSSV